MKTASFAFALATAAALTAPASRDVQAAFTGIQKCEAMDGSIVYTDKPCAQLGAEPQPMSSELGRAVAREALQATNAAWRDTSIAPMHAVATGRRAVASGCARSPTQLAMDVQASIGLHDVNRLAESYHWVGMSHEQAQPVLRQLDALSRMQVTGAQAFVADMGLQFADASGEMMAPSTGTLLLALHGEGGPRSLQLNVEQYAGCYFARF